MGFPAIRIVEKVSELTDAAVATPAENHVLAWNNTTQKWVNRAAAAAGLAALAFSTIKASGQPDVVANSAAADLTIAAGANVSITTDATTRTVTITASGSGGGATNLDGLSDVVITTPATGHILRHNGTSFVNIAPTTAHVTEDPTRLYYTTARVNTDAPNVTIGTANGLSVAAGQVLSLAAATSGAAGAMPSADKVKLDAATASNTAGTLVLRNAGGTINISSLATGTPTGAKFVRDDGTLAVPSGGTATPGGADTQVQFNDGGALGGDTALAWNKTTNVLTLTTGQMVFAGGTVTADAPVDFAQTWNNVAVVFRAFATNITDAASHADSCHFEARESNVTKWSARKGGKTVQSGEAVIGKRATAGVVALSIAGTIATDASAGNYFKGTLTGAHTLGAPTNPVDGQRITYEITNNGSGTATLALDTGAGGFLVPAGVTFALSATASAVDVFGAVYSATKSKWLVIPPLKGY